MSKKKPIHEIRLGRVRAAIWENETSNGTRHNVTFSRLYRDPKTKDPRFTPERTVTIRAGDHKLLTLMTNVVDHQSRLADMLACWRTTNR